MEHWRRPRHVRSATGTGERHPLQLAGAVCPQARISAASPHTAAAAFAVALRMPAPSWGAAAARIRAAARKACRAADSADSAGSAAVMNPLPGGCVASRWLGSA
jgi:hypothetical protein